MSGYLRGLSKYGMCLAVLLAMALVTAACSSSQSSSGKSKDLTVLSAQIPQGLDWDGPDVAQVQSQFGMINLYARLVDYSYKYNPDGTVVGDVNKFRGVLAKDWSQKGLVWTFHLRHGVKSCAGNELTSADVVYTLARDKSVSGVAPIGWFAYNVASVFTGAPVAPNATASDKRLHGEVRAVGKYTVQFKQTAPNQLFLSALSLFAAPIIDKTELSKHATSSDPWAHKWMNSVGAAGFGPYCLSSWTKGQSIVFTKNPNWNIEPVPYYNKVTVKQVANGTQSVASLKAGSAQIAQGLTFQQFASLKNTSGVKLAAFDGTDDMFLAMNFRVPPFDNIKLRQAMAYALPYNEIIQHGYYGLAKKMDYFLPSVTPGLTAKNPYDYDLAKAKTLEAAAGYPDGQGLDKYAKSFQLSYPTEEQTQLQPVALIIQGALKKLGMPVTLNPMPASQIANGLQVTRSLPFAIATGYSAVMPDAGYGIQVSFIPADLGGSSPITNYDNKRVQDLWLNKAKNDPDPTTRLKYINEALAIAAQDVATLPVVETKTIYAHSDGVTGFVWIAANGDLRLDFLRPVGPKYSATGAAK